MHTRMLKHVLFAALAGAALVSPQAGLVSAHESYTVQVPVGDPTPPPYTPHVCTDQSWNSPIVIVHTSEIPHSSDTADMVNAIDQINAQVANVGGSTARVENTQQTTDAFHQNVLYGDLTPTIHVGFKNLTPPAIMGTTTPFSCERFIAIDTDTSWNYKTPDDSGEPYYMAGKKDPKGNVYFRISYQHELMHAFEIYTTPDDPVKDNHPDNVYSFLNYGERPWAHAARDSRIRPLPYDVRQLRRLFPASTSRTDVSVLNTWIDTSTTAADGSGATDQAKLCAPSVGPVSSESAMFSAYCGNANATTVCPGDTIQVHYALANYSTDDVSVTSNLWFSTDAEWDQNDALSSTSHTYSVGAAAAEHKWQAYEVPALSGIGPVYAIVRVTATTPSGVTVKDSIPMRGTVTPRSICSSPAP